MKKNKTVKSPLEINAIYQQSTFGTDKLLHALLRYLILLTAVIGAALSYTAMLGLDLGFAKIALTSAYTFSTFYFLFKSLRGMIAGASVGVIGMLIALKSLDLSLKKLFIGGFNGIYNSILIIIQKRGFDTVPFLDKSYISEFGMLLLMTLPCAIAVALFCRKRTRVAPYVIVLAIPAFIFLLTDGHIELRYFAPAIAAACAMAAMEMSERGVKGVFHSSFVGFTSLVLASLLMLTPIVNVKTAMDSIKLGGLEGIIQLLDPVGIENNVKRNVSPKRHFFTDRKIMTVYTDTASPLYLRSWAGGKFENESWYSVDYDYGYNYSDFASENDYFELTKKFIETAKSMGYGREQIGIGLTDVSIVLAAKQKNLPLPSMSGRTGAIYDGGKTFYPSYTYDGVSTLESPWRGKIITSAAVIDDYENELLSDVIYGYFEYLRYCSHNRSPQSTIGKEFVDRLYKYGNDEYINLTTKLTSFGMSAYNELVTDKSVERVVGELIKDPELEQYFNISVSGLNAEENGVFYNNGLRYAISNYGRAHALEVAKIVADYLADGRKYTTNPKSTGKSVTEELLFGSKEGYCVQFATVGTLIMRRLGFYARYAEGYIVQDYKGSKGYYTYESNVTDRDGHAWCEVWIDGFGWVPLEFTPGFGESNVVGTTKPPETTPPETSEPPIVTTPPPVSDTSSETTTEKPIETTPPVTSTQDVSDSIGPDEIEKGGKKEFAPPWVIAAVLIVIPSVAVISAVVSTASKRKKRLDALIARALSGNHNSEERRRISESLKTALSRALGAYGILPKPGEMPESYGARLEKALILKGLEVPLSLCVEALIKQTYGLGMDENDIKISAYTFRALRMNALGKLGIFKLVIYRIKGVL